MTQVQQDIIRYSNIEKCHILELDPLTNTLTNDHEMSIKVDSNETLKEVIETRETLFIHEKTYDRVMICKNLADHFGHRIYNAMMMVVPQTVEKDSQQKTFLICLFNHLADVEDTSGNGAKYANFDASTQPIT